MLTAIVISFGTTALLLALAYRSWLLSDDDEVPDDIEDGILARYVDIEVADEELLAQMGIEHPLDLTGLYEGIPLSERSVEHSGTLPDRVRLFRRAILDEWIEDGESLEHLVRHVLIHEVGHHFGLSDDDMHALEAQV